MLHKWPLSKFSFHYFPAVGNLPASPQTRFGFQSFMTLKSEPLMLPARYKTNQPSWSLTVISADPLPVSRWSARWSEACNLCSVKI